MELKEIFKRAGIRKILSEAFFLIAMGAVFIMVPQRCGMNAENAVAEKENPATGEITLRDKSDKDGLNLWLRDLERGQGPGE